VRGRGRGVDAAIDDGDANALAHGGVPGTVRGGAGDVVSVAADLLDGPSLWSGGVIGVVGPRGEKEAVVVAELGGMGER
jgi:hypothetical protein